MKQETPPPLYEPLAPILSTQLAGAGLDLVESHPGSALRRIQYLNHDVKDTPVLSLSTEKGLQTNRGFTLLFYFITRLLHVSDIVVLI